VQGTSLNNSNTMLMKQN